MSLSSFSDRLGDSTTSVDSKHSSGEEKSLWPRRGGVGGGGTVRCGSAGHGSADAGGELGGGGGGAFFMSTSTKRNKASCPAAARTVALV